jgi:uncharacterized integral membrane protein
LNRPLPTFASWLLLAKEQNGQCSGYLFTIQGILSAMMRKIRWAILILGILCLTAAMLQNSHLVLLKLFFFETKLPTSTLLLATSVISFLLGALTLGRMMRRREPPAQDPQEPRPTKPLA